MQGIPVQGSATITATTGSATILAANTDPKGRYFIKFLLISIGAFADTATLSIGDGTLVLIGPMLLKDGNGSLFPVELPGDGYELTDEAALTMTVATASATVRVMALGIKRTRE